MMKSPTFICLIKSSNTSIVIVFFFGAIITIRSGICIALANVVTVTVSTISNVIMTVPVFMTVSVIVRMFLILMLMFVTVIVYMWIIVVMMDGISMIAA